MTQDGREKINCSLHKEAWMVQVVRDVQTWKVERETMLANETLTNDEAVAFWSLLCRVTGNREALELLWQDVEVEQKEKSLADLVSLRKKVTGLMVTQTDFDLHVVRRVEQ